jgi:hypothetical protein
VPLFCFRRLVTVPRRLARAPDPFHLTFWINQRDGFAFWLIT